MEFFKIHEGDNALSEIREFYNNTFSDLLYIWGDVGSGKSELVYKSLEGLDKNHLIFQHNCFKHSSINDFLLSFYDSLRVYALAGKITLKKSLDENFAQKVSYYFKNLEKKSVVIIDNFETAQKDREISDFLVHLAGFLNVKVVVISRGGDFSEFENKGLQTKTIKIENNDPETFKRKILLTLKGSEEKDIEELYKQTKGSELFLRMTLSYITTMGTTLSDFMSDFEHREKTFEEFLLIKIASLVPEVYLGLMQNLGIIDHVVGIDFIEKYNLGTKREVDYLTQKLILTKTLQGVYLKDYLKKHFLETLSVQDRIKNIKALLDIYEHELSKSPKDRLLRLSRESMRKQMNDLQGSAPQMEKVTIPRYWPQVRKTPRVSVDEVSKSSETSKGSRESKGPLFSHINTKEAYEAKNVSQQEERADFKALMKNVVSCEKNFNYQEALDILETIQAEKNKEKEFVLKRLASNYVKINGFEKAISSYNKLLEHFESTGERKKYLYTEIKLANLYKSLYRFEKARFYYEDVLSSQSPLLRAKALIGLAELSEGSRKTSDAIDFYEKAILEDVTETKCEAYFKLGLLYDDDHDVENALKFYKKCIETSVNSSQNKFLSGAYSNIALLYMEQYYQKGALEYFKLALQEDEKNNNAQGMHFNLSKMAQIRASQDSISALAYFEKALEYARSLDDNFKIASILVEMGDVYYDKRQDEEALKSYLEAKTILGADISKENKRKLESRIDDMRIKLGTEVFEGILGKYETI